MKTHSFKHTLSLMLALVLLLTCFPGAAQAVTFADHYDADAAVTYAEAHWNDGVGVCDQFVKACLLAGGIEILAGGVDPVKDALVDAGLGTLVTLTLSDDGVHAIQADNPTVQAGDILFFYCEECGKSIHTAIIGGYSDQGFLYTYGHNPGWDRVDWLGNFTHTTDAGEAHKKCYQYYVVTMNRDPYTHAHSFTDGHYEEAHPHKMYAQCSCNAKYYLGWNARVSYCTTCNPPAGDVPIVTATANWEEGNISLTWTTVENALEYQVWRAKSENGTYFNIYSAMGTRMVNSSVTADIVYYYKVSAVLEKDSKGNVVREAVSQVVPCQLSNPNDASVAAIGQTNYETLEAALNAAIPGDTVRLLKDADVSDTLVLVSPGVTLDLDSHTLTAQYFVGLEGSMVTGKAVDKNGTNGAKLVVPHDGLVLSSTAPDGTSAGYKLIPVWNGEHYIFSQAAILQQAFKAGNDNVRLDFIPNFTGYVKNNLFKPNGCEDNDVSIIIAVSWEESGIQVTQEYFYTTPLVIDAMNNKLLFAEMVGCDAKEDLVFRIAIKTDCGVEIVSTEYRY